MIRFNSGQSLIKSLAPMNLGEIRGQPAVVAQMRGFLKNPYPTSFLFYGGTGCGKNATARALAGEFGCDIAGGQLQQQCSGFFDLCGSTLTAGEVQDRLRGAWYAGMNRTGWKMIVVSEADKLREEAINIFLHALDYPPPSAVWVFTSNELENMDRRFTTRCEPIEFESRAEVLEADANDWLKELWKEAGQKGKAPQVVEMPGAIRGGSLSYRSVVIGLQAKLRVLA